MTQGERKLQQGDIVVYNGRAVREACGDLYFYVDNPNDYPTERTRAELLQITGWDSWRLGLPKADLEVVGHVEPFPTNTGDAIGRDHNFLPLNKRDILAPWLGRRELPDQKSR